MVTWLEPWKLSVVSCSCDLQHNTGDSSCQLTQLGQQVSNKHCSPICVNIRRQKTEEILTLVTMNNTLARMQTLVGQAGEALGITEDPLGTVVGARVGAGVRRGRSHYTALCCRYWRPPGRSSTRRTGPSTWRSATSSTTPRRGQQMR